MAELVSGQTAQVFGVEFAFPNKIREQQYERGVLVLVLVVELLTKVR